MSKYHLLVTVALSLYIYVYVKVSYVNVFLILFEEANVIFNSRNQVLIYHQNFWMLYKNWLIYVLISWELIIYLYQLNETSVLYSVLYNLYILTH